MGGRDGWEFAYWYPNAISRGTHIFHLLRKFHPLIHEPLLRMRNILVLAIDATFINIALSFQKTGRTQLLTGFVFAEQVLGLSSVKGGSNVLEGIWRSAGSSGLDPPFAFRGPGVFFKAGFFAVQRIDVTLIIIILCVVTFLITIILCVVTFLIIITLCVVTFKRIFSGVRLVGWRRFFFYSYIRAFLSWCQDWFGLFDVCIQ